ncbi:MAG TPA: thioesterase family protein [Candidatus Deferrimicrobium sp.]|nr:thioesterase family protein [Candidatus Deferrimicrobium sp.]
MTTAARSRVAATDPADPRDLEGDFGHRTSVEVRFADTDAMGHVNNAVYLTYVESARVRWWLTVTGESLEREDGRDQGLILAEAEIAFRSPLFFGETVVVETRASRIGRTSLGLDHRLTAGRPGGPSRLVATCRSVIVRYDYATETPVPWPAGLVAAIEGFEGHELRGG